MYIYKFTQCLKLNGDNFENFPKLKYFRCSVNQFQIVSNKTHKYVLGNLIIMNISFHTQVTTFKLNIIYKSLNK